MTLMLQASQYLSGSVGFGHVACKNVPEITYNVLSGTLSLYTTTKANDNIPSSSHSVDVKTGFHRYLVTGKLPATNIAGNL